MYEFYKENADSVNAFIIVILLCACGIWLTYDYHRNEPIYNDTDNAMERIEERIKSIESRLDSLSARLDTAQKTLTDLGGRINTGAELAKEVTIGIDGVQGRLDSAIQRSGRIANLISDIETANRPGAKNP